MVRRQEVYDEGFAEGFLNGKKRGMLLTTLLAGGLLAVGVEERKLGCITSAYKWTFGCPEAATATTLEDYKLATPLTERGYFRIRGPVIIETYGPNQELVCRGVSYFTTPDAQSPAYTGITVRFRKGARTFFSSQRTPILDANLVDQRFGLTIDHNPERASANIDTFSSTNPDQDRPIIINRNPATRSSTIAIDDSGVINVVN